MFLTYYKVRVKFVCDRHYYMLKCKQIICVAHTFRRPRYVNVPKSVSLIHRPLIVSTVLSLTQPSAAVIVVAVRSRWVKVAIFVYMQRYV